MEVLITYFLKYLLAPFLVAAILLIMNGIKAIKKQMCIRDRYWEQKTNSMRAR